MKVLKITLLFLVLGFAVLFVQGCASADSRTSDSPWDTKPADNSFHGGGGGSCH